MGCNPLFFLAVFFGASNPMLELPAHTRIDNLCAQTGGDLSHVLSTQNETNQKAIAVPERKRIDK